MMDRRMKIDRKVGFEEERSEGLMVGRSEGQKVERSIEHKAYCPCG